LIQKFISIPNRKPMNNVYRICRRCHILFFSLLIVLNVGIFTDVFSTSVNGQEILDKRISVSARNLSLRSVLADIERVAGIKFSFRSKLIPASEKVSLQANQERLADILDKIFLNRQIHYEVDGNYIVLTRKDVTMHFEQHSSEEKSMIASSDKVVRGVVKDAANNSALPGVSVFIRGTTIGTTSDVDGRFALSVPGDDAVLVFSFIGYATQEVTVGSQIEFTISLAADIVTLGEVIVVGYGTQKKSDVIGSISSVKGEDFTLRSMPNFEAGLQGQVSGAFIQSQSGAPGAPVRILVRGPGSLNLSTDPLYIIDGMPISLSSYGLGSSNQSPMALINQNDIERVEVLKDAAATSIYGSRASNGVIIVTTKSGKRTEGSSTTFSYATGFSQLTKTPNDVGYANTKEWFQIMDEAYKNSSKNNAGTFPSDLSEYYSRTPSAASPLASPRLNREEAEAINTNWFHELFHTGTFQSYNLSSMKGTDKSAYYLSGNYRKDNGVQRNNSLERFTVRSNLDFKPTDNITISSKLTFGYTKNDQQNSGITSITDNALPWFPVREPGNPNRYFNAYTEVGNAAANVDPKNFLNRVEQYRGLGGISLNYRVPAAAGLSFQTELSGDVIQSNQIYWQSRDIRASSDFKPQSRADDQSVTYNSLNYNAYTKYDRLFGEHAISLTAGAEATRTFQNTRQMVATGLKGNYADIQNPENKILMKDQKEGERYLFAFFGRAGYKFKDRYLAGLSVRRDGTSVFAPQYRWGTFLAVSAGWIISEERFMSFLGNGTFLKLRGSYGEIGNQAVPDVKTVTYNTSQLYGDATGISGTVPTNIPVRDLRWETTKSSDIGIDFGFMNNRINGSVAYYNRKVTDMIMRAGLPLSTGIWSPNSLILGQGSYQYVASNAVWGNFGDMVNRGFEVELHTINIDKGAFKWKTDINVGLNKNTIKSLTPDIDGQGRGLENIYGNAISRKGNLRGMWYVADYAGVDPQTGVTMIYALDTEKFKKTGETTRLKNGDEDVLLPATTTNIKANRFYQKGKSGDPRYQGGVTNTFSYKGFDFSFQVVFSGGNYILDYDRQRATIVNPTRNILKEVYNNAWRNPGDRTKYPQLRANFTYNINGSDVTGFDASNSFHNGELYKGDFVRLRSVQLGYSLSSRMVEAIKMKALRIYVSGSNLWTKTKYPGFDPEGTGSTQDPLTQSPGFVYYANAIPQLRTITVGIDAKF
jgi:TonB-linked SusC/RagA family outer membrane protein